MTNPEFLENIPLDTRVRAILSVVEGMFHSKSGTRDELEGNRRKYISDTAESLDQPRYKIVIALNTGLRLTSSEHLNLMILNALQGDPDELDSKLELMLEDCDLDESMELMRESTRKTIRGE